MKAFIPLLRVFLLLAGTPLQASAQPPGTALDVLHWWTSVSERAAVEQLKLQLAGQGVIWKDAAVAGGGGTSASKVLTTRMLMDDAPDVSPAFGQWSTLGLALPLNTVATRRRWREVLFPEVMSHISDKGRVVAAPLGIHRINSMLFNRPLFARFGLEPPRTWAQFENVAATLKNNGVRPIAWSDQPWQVLSVLEVLLLSDGGPALYRDLIVRRDPAAWEDPRVTQALQRLRWLRGLSEELPVNRAWTESLQALLDGKVAMMISGDWAKGELMAWGASPQREFGCFVAPGTEGMHIYKIDALSMVMTRRPVRAAQETMAEVLTSVATQRAYNQTKGSVPVRRDSQVRDMDACMRDSWETFAAREGVRVPSLALMDNEVDKTALGLAVVRFVTEPDMQPLEVQHKLAMIVRATGLDAKRP